MAFRFTNGATVTFLEVEALANRFANLFAAFGLRRGDHAAVLLGNGIEIIALVWAATRSGVYFTPVANSLGAIDTACIVDNSTAKLLAAEARCRHADDMIIAGGVNVYPQEIEAALEERPGVAECGVVGFPDEKFQERPMAFVVPAAGHSGSKDALAADLEAFVRVRLGRIKWPGEIRIVSELPRNPTGKLLRRELRRAGWLAPFRKAA